MSLIMDALKKAQQLQLKGSKRSPILNYSQLDQKRGKRSKKQWILISAGLISLCILLIVLLRPASPPLATQPNQVIVPMEGKPSTPLTEKASAEPTQETLSLRKDEKPLPTDQVQNPAGQAPNRAGSGQSSTEGLPHMGGALKDRYSHRIGEKGLHGTNTSLPFPTQKEEVPSKSIGVEQEGGRDRSSTSDVLHHFNSGVSFYNQREFSKAIQAYQKVIELDPNYVEAYNNLGIIYQMMGDVERAFEFYQKSTEINPQYEKGYNNLGILLLLKGRNEEALEAFQKALVINSNNIESHINLGILFKKKGQWEKAIESYQKALAINPLHRETHYNMALLYEQLENFESAISHYQKFIQLSTKSQLELVSKVQRHLNVLVKARRNKEK